MKSNIKLLSAVLFIVFASTATIAQSKKDKERAEIDKMTTKALNQLYKNNPEAKSKIKNSKGYAVFSNFGMNLLVVSSANGSGKAVSGGKSTYMKMYSGGVGVGAGAKKYYGIFVFKTSKAYNNFITDGWQGGGQADAAAKDKKKGAAAAGAISISPEITFYQITDKGLAAQATIQGTKYWKDKDLN
jgi:lipid-binding SYLF domain-containing protein